MSHQHVQTKWVMLTPSGAMRAFGRAEADNIALWLQSIVANEKACTLDDWKKSQHLSDHDIETLKTKHWIYFSDMELNSPVDQLDVFIRHIIGAMSGTRQAILASDEGFCIGYSGFNYEDSEILSGAVADYSEYTVRQSKRGWNGASLYLSFYNDIDLLIPTHTFIPLWIDESGYWLILGGEPLLNSAALVELCWGIKKSASKFMS